MEYRVMRLFILSLASMALGPSSWAQWSNYQYQTNPRFMGGGTFATTPFSRPGGFWGAGSGWGGGRWGLGAGRPGFGFGPGGRNTTAPYYPMDFGMPGPGVVPGIGFGNEAFLLAQLQQQMALQQLQQQMAIRALMMSRFGSPISLGPLLMPAPTFPIGVEPRRPRRESGGGGGVPYVPVGPLPSLPAPPSPPAPSETPQSNLIMDCDPDGNRENDCCRDQQGKVVPVTVNSPAGSVVLDRLFCANTSNGSRVFMANEEGTKGVTCGPDGRLQSAAPTDLDPSSGSEDLCEFFEVQGLIQVSPALSRLRCQYPPSGMGTEQPNRTPPVTAEAAAIALREYRAAQRRRRITPAGGSICRWDSVPANVLLPAPPQPARPQPVTRGGTPAAPVPGAVPTPARPEAEAGRCPPGQADCPNNPAPARLPAPTDLVVPGFRALLSRLNNRCEFTQRNPASEPQPAAPTLQCSPLRPAGTPADWLRLQNGQLSVSALRTPVRDETTEVNGGVLTTAMNQAFGSAMALMGLKLNSTERDADRVSGAADRLTLEAGGAQRGSCFNTVAAGLQAGDTLLIPRRGAPIPVVVESAGSSPFGDMGDCGGSPAPRGGVYACNDKVKFENFLGIRVFGFGVGDFADRSRPVTAGAMTLVEYRDQLQSMPGGRGLATELVSAFCDRAMRACLAARPGGSAPSASTRYRVIRHRSADGSASDQQRRECSRPPTVLQDSQCLANCFQRSGVPGLGVSGETPPPAGAPPASR